MTGLAYYTFAIKTGGSSYLVRYVVCIHIIQFSGGCLYSLIEKKRYLLQNPFYFSSSGKPEKIL